MPRQHTEIEFLDVVYVHGVEEGPLVGEMGTCDFSTISEISEIDRPSRVAPTFTTRLRFCKMLRSTDANRTTVVNVPTELTEHMGIFNDMLDTVSSDGDREPVFSPPPSYTISTR